jgi:putative aldouronate transport system permease protein
MKESKVERLFSALNVFLLLLLAAATLFPFLHVLAQSLSSETAVISGQVGLFPVDPQLGTYQYVMGNSQFTSSFRVSVIITVLGTLGAMVVTTFAAYTLSKPHLPGRNFFLVLFIFAMLFHGGIIPNYLLMRSLGLLDSIWVLILPALVNVFNLLIIKNFFEGTPESLEEAARIDGANTFSILFRIVLPISLPVLATISLFYAVAYWNDFFRAMIYISRPDLKPLQLYLYEIVTQTQRPLTDVPVDSAMNLTPAAVRSATIMATTFPILVVYPFLQKYFVKGIVVGSVKG